MDLGGGSISPNDRLQLVEMPPHPGDGRTVVHESGGSPKRSGDELPDFFHYFPLVVCLFFQRLNPRPAIDAGRFPALRLRTKRNWSLRLDEAKGRERRICSRPY